MRFLKQRKGRNGAEVPKARPQSDIPVFHEQFKALRSKIDDHFEKDGCKTMAITSALAEEGKTVTCVNLAMNIAYTGRKKVLIVDTDMRKSGLAREMNLDPVPGLSEYLSGTAKIPEIFRNSQVPGLYVIPGGAEPTSPADLLAGEQFRTFLRSARENFDVILLDTPPVLLVSDTLSLREQVDWFLLVYRAGSTPYPMFKQVVSEIGEQKVLGVVINRVKPMTDKYYKKYYSRYYRK